MDALEAQFRKRDPLPAPSGEGRDATPPPMSTRLPTSRFAQHLQTISGESSPKFVDEISKPRQTEDQDPRAVP